MLIYSCKFYSLVQDMSGDSDMKYTETTATNRIFENNVTLMKS